MFFRFTGSMQRERWFCASSFGVRRFWRSSVDLLRDLGIDKKMSKEELIQFEGLVIEILPDARYRVQLDAGYEVLAYTVALLR